jgi:hypothetical protein
MTGTGSVMTGPGSPLLVLILGRDPLTAAVADAAMGWEADGVLLTVVTLTPRARITPTAQQVTLLGRPVGSVGVDPSTTGKPRSAARKALRKLHLDPVRWAAMLLVLTSPGARRLVTRAEVVLAADPASVPLGWVLARRRGQGKVFRTVSAAGRALNCAPPP